MGLIFWGEGLRRDVLGFESFPGDLRFLDVGFSAHGPYLDLPNISDDGLHPHPLAYIAVVLGIWEILFKA